MTDEVDVFVYEEWSVTLGAWLVSRRLATAEKIDELIPARKVGEPRRVKRSELEDGFWPSKARDL